MLVLIAGEVHADFKLVRNSTVYVASGNQYLETMDSVHADNACASGVLCSWNNQTIESHDGCTPSSVTLAVGQGTSVVCRYHYHNNSSPTQSLSWSATISVSRPACTARTLTLSGGGTVRALNSLEPFSAAVSCNGVPEPNVRVVLSTEPRGLPLLPAAGLFKSQNEMASCVGALDCLTDADGRIAFGFSAPDTEGDYLVRAVCADFNKPCTPPSPVEVRVEQCAVTLTIAGPGEMEPSSYSAEFMVSAEDCDENEVAELEIEIAATVETGSGFHDHSDSSYERPRGHLSVDAAGCNGIGFAAMQCATNADGRVLFRFLSPAPAGSHQVDAKCADAATRCNTPSHTIHARVDGLEPIPGSTLYTLSELDPAEECHPVGQNIGDNGKHNGLNHFLTPEAASILQRVAFNYAASFETPSTRIPEYLHINDASLEWGGVFDFKGTWVPPHNRHRRGTVVDIRANECPGAIPTGFQKKFIRAAKKEGAVARHEYAGQPTEHFHVRLKKVDQ